MEENRWSDEDIHAVDDAKHECSPRRLSSCKEEYVESEEPREQDLTEEQVRVVDLQGRNGEHYSYDE